MTGAAQEPKLSSMLTNTLEAAVAARSEEAPARAEPVISARGLRKSYGDKEVVRGVDLEVRRGEVVAFLGPNGAGKTTTVEILEGFREADAGDVSVLGADPATAGRAWRERVGIVLQESEPEAGLTVRECVQRYAGYYRAPRPVDETLARVGLADQADSRCTTLSGGQRRRLDVAIALIGDPELLFLDEPTTGFDPSARRAAWELVASLREGGMTVLLTTHYMEEAERLADRIVVIRAGEVIATGTPRTLGGRDRAAAVVTFALPSNLSPGDLPHALATRVAMRRGGRFELATDHVAGDLHVLSGWAVDHDIDLAELEVRRPTLEDVYLELTA
jgi:ABC-2 type transport system ATP-binding protein